MIASSDPSLKIVDATWFMPGTGVGAEQHVEKRITKDTVFFDHD